jgi:hypothetical protein
MKELSANTPLPPIPASSHEKGKRRDWLALLLRECLGMAFAFEYLQASPANLDLELSGPEVSHTYPGS